PSIIAESTSLPACTHRPKKALFTSQSTAASGGTVTGTTLAKERCGIRIDFVRDFAMVAPFLVWRPPAYHMQAKGAATFHSSVQQILGHLHATPLIDLLLP